MSKQDYTKFSKPIKETISEEEIVDEVISEEEINEIVNEVVNEIVSEPEKTKTVGVVTDCIRLNVRKKPSPYADVICRIDVLTEVEIDKEQSTNDFYKICTASGIEGFCMREYIAISK